MKICLSADKYNDFDHNEPSLGSSRLDLAFPIG